MKYISRTIEPIINQASQSFKVVMVNGMRQVGKSTLLQHLSQNRTQVTLDDLKPLTMAQTMRDVFFKQYPAPILIDEIQRSPELCMEIKSLVDREQKNGLVWVTGSQRFSLMKNLSESLAGRMAEFELLPFSLYERQGKAFEQKPYLPDGSLPSAVLDVEKAPDIWKLIWQGAWPAVIDMNEDERHWFFNGLVHTYIERDVHQNAGVSKLDQFHRFLAILATRIGQEFQISKVASEANIALQTAREWLSIAEASGIIYLLPPFYENIGKVVIKKPKLYFTDTGLACWLCDITSPEALKQSYMNGSFFENFVIMELRKSWLHNGKRSSFYFYRDSAFNEIDLLIKVGTVYHPIEIKTTENPMASMVKAFDLIKGGSFERGAGAVICLTKNAHYLRSDVVAHSIFEI